MSLPVSHIDWFCFQVRWQLSTDISRRMQIQNKRENDKIIKNDLESFFDDDFEEKKNKDMLKKIPSNI